MTHELDIALTLAIQGKHDMAEQLLREKLKSTPDDPRILFNLGWHNMRHGRMYEGFTGLNVGRYLNVFGSEAIPGKIWKDEDLNGKILLLRSEGGLGDEIMNVRFAKDFEAMGARVIVACHNSLMSLFAKAGFMCVSNEAVKNGAVYYDYWVPAMSAPYVLKSSYETFSGKPYLKAGTRNLYERPGTLKVGIRWAGNPKFEHEQHRKFDPQPLFDLHQLPGVTLYSLQRDDDAREFLPFGDLKDQMYSWDATAEIINSLDLVITSCTSVAHCAAALGKETWVIVPALPYYCWAIPGEKTVWYDSVTIFRQQEYGDWSHPMNAIRAKLEDRVQLKLAA